MKNLMKSALDIQSFFHRKKWKFCVIGGLANWRWGIERGTRDVDLTLLTGLGDEELYIDAILARYESMMTEPREFALQNRVLILQSPYGYKIDVALGGLPYEKKMIQRSSMHVFEPGVNLRTCSSEDLVVMKAFAGREHDWGDAKGVLIRQGKEIDRALIRRELKPLAELKGQPEIMEKLKAAFREVDAEPDGSYSR